MNKEAFLAWLETEGSFTLTCCPKSSQYHLRATITQGNVEVLKKIKDWLGFGRIAKAHKSRSYLFFESPTERENLISLLDSIDEREWLTNKYEKYQVWKDIHYYLKSRANQLWREESLSKLLDMRDKLLVKPEQRKSKERILMEFKEHRNKYKKKEFREQIKQEKLKQMEKRLSEYEKAMRLREGKRWGQMKISKAIGIPESTVTNWIYRGVRPRLPKECS